MTCSECGHEFENGESYFETEEGFKCELCFDAYQERERVKSAKEYTPYWDGVDIEIDRMRGN